jgi:hypothetical protein
LKIPSIRAVAVGAALAAVAVPALADHSWGGYHWARSTSELTVSVGDNVDIRWKAYLQEAVRDWNASTVIQSPLVPGSTSPKNCKAVAGTIQVCNANYGRTGWLGIAQIWISGGHISQAITKVNDTYFDTATYNKPEWRRLVMCQELGHDYGLDHQDESFSNPNLGSCQDYTNNPLGPPSNEHPNAHDYDQLLTIYNHVESGPTVTRTRGAAGTEIGHELADLGRAVAFDRLGRPIKFERILSPNERVLTHVTWAMGEGPGRRFR